MRRVAKLGRRPGQLRLICHKHGIQMVSHMMRIFPLEVRFPLLRKSSVAGYAVNIFHLILNLFPTTKHKIF